MAAEITHRIDEGGVLRVEFDNPGEKVNTLNATILQQLDTLLDQARDDRSVRGLLLVSAKPGMFIAGMDIEQIASVADAQQGADGARQGQAVFQKIADLGKPSVAAIRGTCLGGGLELSLACDFRVASSDPATRIGLPEVQLGIIPGFGGTQRFPRRAGLLASLDLILTGRGVDGRKARKLGLVDIVVAEAYVEREAKKLLLRAADQGREKTLAAFQPKRPFSAKLMESFGPLRSYALKQAAKKVAKRASREHYPAPYRAIEAIESAYTKQLPQGLDHEARLIGELIPSPTAQSLMWLFKSQTALKSDAGAQALPRKIRRVGVLGAGVMGGGIAQLAADKELPVRLKDIQYDSVLTALQTASKVWSRKVKRRRLSKGAFARKMGNIAPTLDYRGFRSTDIVIEAVVERLDIKQAVLAELEQVIDERAVFASNTSSIPISDIAARAMHPERVVGMHFFNPVHRMPLIEVIAGRDTSPEAVATVHKLATRMGKVPVVVKDSPGFLVNRILTLYLLEAMLLLNEGVRMEVVDRAMKRFGMPMGPFELMDQVGLDVGHHVGEMLKDAFGDRIGPAETVIGKLVEDGRLGQKNQRGFYRYKDGKPTEPDSSVYALAGSPAPRDLPPEMLEERLVLTMINEAALCLDEGVTRSARDLDMAMVMGTGFPPFRGGLLRHADVVGIPIVVDRLSRLAEAQGSRFQPARILHGMVREQRRFHDSDRQPTPV